MADHNIGARASSLSLGTTVIVLYAIFVSMVTFGFGTYIYRTTWQSNPPVVQVNDAAGEAAPDTDIDNNIFLLRREKLLENEKVQIAGEIRGLRAEQADVQTAINLSYGPIARERNEMRLLVNRTIIDLEPYQYALVDLHRVKYELALNNGDLQPFARLTELLDVLQAGLGPSGVDADTLARFEDLSAQARIDLDAALEEIEQANAASHKIQQDLVVVREKIAALVAQNERHDAAIAALRSVLPIDSVIRARLSSLSLETPFAPDVLLRLVSFPTIFLTLIVTIAAGALGTVVAFSRRYYSDSNAEDLSMSRLFVNVGEGIAAAIAIFLFSGAGMLALTQGGGGANDVELSPYTVAFVAFLSGFMAEDAFAAIQAAGKRIFNTEATDPEDELEKARALVAKADADGAGAT